MSTHSPTCGWWLISSRKHGTMRSTSETKGRTHTYDDLVGVALSLHPWCYWLCYALFTMFVLQPRVVSKHVQARVLLVV